MLQWKHGVDELTTEQESSAGGWELSDAAQPFGQ